TITQDPVRGGIAGACTLAPLRPPADRSCGSVETGGCGGWSTAASTPRADGRLPCAADSDRATARGRGVRAGLSAGRAVQRCELPDGRGDQELAGTGGHSRTFHLIVPLGPCGLVRDVADRSVGELDVVRVRK